MIEFPDWVKTTDCTFRSHTCFVRDAHGLTRHRAHVPNWYLPMSLVKAQGGWRA